MSATLLREGHAESVDRAADSDVGTSVTARCREPEPDGRAPGESSPALAGLIENAEYLVRSAIEAHIDVDPELSGRIIAARRKGDAA